MIRLAALVPLLLALAGCTGLLHSNAAPEQVYYLRARAAASESARPANLAAVRVGRPVPGPGLDSSHILLLESDRRMSYYTASRWPAVLPEVIEDLTAETLRASGSWADVQTSESAFPSEYLLQIRIRRFDADYPSSSAGRSATPPEVHVAFDCTLGRRSGREVIATFAAEGSANAAANKLSDIVAAFEDAVNAALAAVATRAADAAYGAGQKVDSPVTSIKR
jgi:cholesterol transport system auxiliary component